MTAEIQSILSLKSYMLNSLNPNCDNSVLISIPFHKTFSTHLSPKNNISLSLCLIISYDALFSQTMFRPSWVSVLIAVERQFSHRLSIQ